MKPSEGIPPLILDPAPETELPPAASRLVRKPSWWRRGMMLAGAVGLGFLLRSMSHTKWTTVVVRLGPLLPLTAAVAIGWMTVYARGLWVIIDGAVGWGRLIYNKIVGEAYNVAMPLGDVGGDPFRIADIAAELGTATAVRGIVLDRLVYATSGFLFSAASATGTVWAFALDSRIVHLLVAYTVVATVAAVGLFAFVTHSASARLIGRLLRLAKVQLPQVPSPLPAATFMRALGWNLLGRAGVWAEVALLLWGLGQPVRFDALVATGALSSIAGILFTFIPNGLGVNEGAVVFALTVAGYGESIGLAVGLARRVRQLLLTALGLVLHALWRPMRAGRTQLKEHRRAAAISSAPAAL